MLAAAIDRDGLNGRDLASAGSRRERQHGFRFHPARRGRLGGIPEQLAIDDGPESGECRRAALDSCRGAGAGHPAPAVDRRPAADGNRAGDARIGRGIRKHLVLWFRLAELRSIAAAIAERRQLPGAGGLSGRMSRRRAVGVDTEGAVAELWLSGRV